MRNIWLGASFGAIVACGLAVRFLPGIVVPALIVMGLSVAVFIAAFTLEK